MTRLDLFGDRCCMAACLAGVAYIIAWHMMF